MNGHEGRERVVERGRGEECILSSCAVMKEEGGKRVGMKMGRGR